MAVLSDPISDFLTRLKNASRAGNDTFNAPFSKAKAEIARILKDEGYIWNYEIDDSGKFPELKVSTRFVDGKAALTDLKKVSKPGRRSYVGVDEIPRVRSGLGISILSTSKGILSNREATKQNVGGELLAQVW